MPQSPRFILKKNRKIVIVRNILLSLLGLAVLIIISYFLFRNILLRNFIDSKLYDFKKNYNASFKIKDIEISGLNSLYIKGISLTPENKDTLIKIKSATAKINLIKLFTGNVTFNNFELDDTYINLVKNDSVDNFLFLLKQRTKKDSKTSDQFNYAEKIDDLLYEIFDEIPTTLKIKNFNIKSSIDKHTTTLHINDFSITDQHFSSVLHVMEDNEKIEYLLKGFVDKTNRRTTISICSADNSKIKIPYILHRFNLKASFDSIRISIYSNKVENNILHTQGYISVNGMVINHPRISTENIKLDKVSINYTCNIGKNYFEVDSSTAITFNKLVFNPYVYYIPKPTKQLAVILNRKSFNAQDLFESIPVGFFRNIDGIKTSGKMSYYLKFFVDLSLPDSLKLEGDLIPENFKILKYGKTNFAKINDPFTYTVYDNGDSANSILIGPENKNYRTLDQISILLREAVMNSEDGAFYWHKGFLSEAFKLAIVDNIKQGRFVRGASTISMQLVKNVFLTRNKTIARKLEEMLIVWLIENNKLISKERMYEVYLNIIEWGPGIHGANEAARYYFNKDARFIELDEAIFMALIIPSPKHFKYNFNNGHLKDGLSSYYSLLSKILLLKGVIGEHDYRHLVSDVQLKGEARREINFIKPLPFDSLFFWKKGNIL